jgi:hypothetical protein
MPDAHPAPECGPLPRGHLLALNRSFRRTLEAENKSPRTVEAYTDAVRFLALYCEAHGKPIPARRLRREHIQDFIADQLARWKPATAHNRYRSLHAFFRLAVVEGDLQASPMDGRKQLDGAASEPGQGTAKASPYRAMVERTGSSEGTYDLAHPTPHTDRPWPESAGAASRDRQRLGSPARY